MANFLSAFYGPGIVLSNLPEDTQLVSSRAVIQAQTGALLDHTPYHYAEPCHCDRGETTQVVVSATSLSLEPYV